MDPKRAARRAAPGVVRLDRRDTGPGVVTGRPGSLADAGGGAARLLGAGVTAPVGPGLALGPALPVAPG